MVIYTCEICNYETIQISHYKRHLKTKRHLTNIDITKESYRIPKNHQESKNYHCPICNLLFTTNSNMNRHLKKCKINNSSNDTNQELLKLKLENQKLNYEIKIKDTENKCKQEIINYIQNTNTSSISNNNNSNNVNNSHNTINNNITNNITLNFLNQNYSHVISIDDFKKLVDNNKMPTDIVEMIESAFNNDTLQAKSQSLIVYMKNVCKQNDVDMLPFICNDSNIRSHKEKTIDGWKVVINNDNIIYLIDSTFRNISIQYPDKTIIAEPQLRLEDLPKSIKKNLSSIKAIEVINNNEEQIRDKMIRLKYYFEKLINFLKQKDDVILKSLISSIYIDNFINVKSLYKANEEDILTNDEFKEILRYLSLRDVDNITIHKLADLFGYTQ